jgi:hypothetical protein
MKHLLLFILIIFLLGNAGCVRSLYPLFTEKDYIFVARLAGTWPDKSGDTWIFSKQADKSYRLQYYQHEFGGGIFKEGTPGDTGTFDAHLGRLGKNLFLDVFPEQGSTDSHTGKIFGNIKNDFYNWHFLPMHSIMKVWFENDSLRLSLLDNGWLKKMIDNKSVRISHERLDDQIILTASTEELQQLVTKYGDDERAFPEQEKR